MRVYGIKHNETGHFLSAVKGGSYWEGEEEGLPRLFKSVKAASKFREQWVRGQHKSRIHEDKFSGEVWDEQKIIPVPGRTITKLTIITFELKEID